MRLKARIKRLEADVEALRHWGPIRTYEQKLEYLAIRRRIEEHQAKVAAAKQVMAALLKSPPAPPPAPGPAQPVAAASPVAPAPHASPPEPREQPPVDRPVEFPREPVAQPFEPIHTGLVRWRIRGPDDDDDNEDDDEDREEEDYDPFADE
jgi:hypothetical protein